jgi:hypothetical protein
VYERCELEFDEVFQRCIDVLRVFFASTEGKLYLSELNVYPPFLTKSFIDFAAGENLIQSIKADNEKSLVGNSEVTLSVDDTTFSNLLKNLR